MTKPRFLLLAGLVLFGLFAGPDTAPVDAAPVCQGGNCIELAPATAIVPLGASHTVTATLSLAPPAVGVGSGTLHFRVAPGGPCAGQGKTVEVPADPLPFSIPFTYTCNLAGTDTILATWQPGFENFPTATATVQWVQQVTFCVKGPVNEVLDPATGRFPGNAGPDTVVRVDLGQSVQTAVTAGADANNDGYIIIGVVANGAGMWGGHTTQSLVISANYAKPFALIGCSVTLHDPTPTNTQPTARIATSAGSPQNIFVMDLHANGSKAAGWKVEGNGRYLRNVATDSNATGTWVVGNGNTLHNSSAEGNTGVGIKIQGSSNKVEADAFSNGSHGIQVVGNSNQLVKNDVGDRGKGNGGDGMNVSGNNNQLTENGASANRGDGFEIRGTGNRLLKNQSNQGPAGGSLENTGFEYRLVNAIVNQGENQKDDVLFAASAAGSYE